MEAQEPKNIYLVAETCESLEQPGAQLLRATWHLDLRAYKVMPEGTQKNGKDILNSTVGDADCSAECKVKLDAAQKAVKG